ncbi:MAG: YsnF/AvaK domain-containing protein [Candidatus Eremiobacteraeota bacterium]|nr:YsnF/AvaK domain-containing protein [Candidatus Eremiobacteraeota bacterium]MBC5805934.1 YsnF/AvaK domain-containing protein [Candidatus Eremiobacteraeota bacterium]
MAGQTIGGLFKDRARGEAALEELQRAKFSSAQISEVADDDDTKAEPPKKLTNPLTDFFRDHTTTGTEFCNNLTELGMSTEDAKYFESGVARGGALVTVKADARASEAVTILQRAGADLGSVGRGSGMATAPRGSDADQSLQLREERLSIDKRRVASGAARIGKRVVSERQDVDVPVSHDELVIERRPVTGAAAGGAIGKDETITVPLSRDEVKVGKETFATEEVEIGKRSVAGTERVSDTVKREELIVEGDEARNRPTR